MKEKSKKHYKIMTKAMHIIAKISKIFLIIGAFISAVAFLVIPIIGSSIKFDANEKKITVFNQTLKYEKDEGKYKFYVGDDSIKITDEEDVEIVDTILDYLDNANMPVIIIAIELILVVSLLTLLFNYIALRYLDKVFVDINKNDTPFTKEHPDNFRKAGNYIVAVFIIRLVGGVIVSAISDFNIPLNFGALDIMLILALFIVAHIFEYGYKLQSNSDIKMIEQ